MTKTVNEGDNVVLSVVTDYSDNLKWRRNLIKIGKFNGKKSILIENASVQDDGIYECYVGLKESHAVMRLIVRGKNILFFFHFKNTLSLQVFFLLAFNSVINISLK